ncbi:MAG: hypothetical protein HFH72_16525 [Lachnospiraceae bacterium]|nr:hypothetical protein [Lachnospiraceae bacterium]
MNVIDIFPKSHVSYRKPRAVSTEPRERARQIMIAKNNVTIQVLDTSSNETIWNQSYNENTNFKIELTDLKADSEYLLQITTVQSKKVTLTITTEEKRIKDKDKSDKYNIEIK